ncbi:MAG TPA: tetratricopeptide repeat protein [bacterium]|nr:tetratricopeptide repeat protein [bacterium]
MTGAFDKAAHYFQAALDQDPNDYEANLDFGMAYLTYCRPPDPKNAERYIARAAQKHPDAFNQYLLELCARQLADPVLGDRCRVALTALMGAGKDQDVQIRAPDLPNGRAQYEAMLASIPVMKLYVPRDGWLSTWAAEKFAGVGLRNHLLWRPAKHLLATAAETDDDADWAGDLCLYLGPDDPDRQGKRGLGLAESYWESFVFEMLNDQHRERSTWIWMRSRAGKLTDEEYGAMNRAFEQQTDLATARFYQEQWKPYCDQMGLPSNPALWCPRNPFPEEAVYKVYSHYDQAYTAKPAQ